jgi:hypothetical protein
MDDEEDMPRRRSVTGSAGRRRSAAPEFVRYEDEIPRRRSMAPISRKSIARDVSPPRRRQSIRAEAPPRRQSIRAEESPVHRSPAYGGRLEEFRAERRLERGGDAENDVGYGNMVRRRSSAGLKRRYEEPVEERFEDPVDGRYEERGEDRFEEPYEEEYEQERGAFPSPHREMQRGDEEDFDEPVVLDERDQELEQEFEEEEGSRGLETVMEDEDVAPRKVKQRTPRKKKSAPPVVKRTLQGPDARSNGGGAKSRQQKIISRRSASVPVADYGGSRKSTRAHIKPIKWYNGDYVKYNREFVGIISFL